MDLNEFHIGEVSRYNTDQKLAAISMVVLEDICKMIDCPLHQHLKSAAHNLGFGLEFDFYSKDLDSMRLKTRTELKGIDAFQKAIKDAERKQNPDMN